MNQHLEHTITSLRQDIESLQFLVDELFTELRHAQDAGAKDDLTGAYRRKHLFNELKGDLMKEKQQTYIIMVDVDNFKSINDTYGHVTGDNVLQQVVKTIEDLLESNEYIGRYGGEEFMVVSPNGFARAIKLAEDIRVAIQNCKFVEMEKNVTVSLGVGKAHSKDTLKDDINRVDHFLLEAKRQGKNRVICEQV